IAKNREEGATHARSLREEVTGTLRGMNDTVVRTLGDMSSAQHRRLEGFSSQLAGLTESNERRMEALRSAVDARLVQIQNENSKKLEEMRKTVDENLHGTLERRLGEAFSFVSERLEQVHKGLGEMQSLATGVGDLKRVLSNVKVRGILGENQLGALLEEIFAPDQYASNVATREGSGDRVEFAIRLPGKDEMEGKEVLLPIDAKFPTEDYQRLVGASERADAEAVAAEGRNLEARIADAARQIRDKYLNPPRTTDFAIMYLPSEGLYAEVVRRPGLVVRIQRDCQVVVAGPSTAAAMFNALLMGFRTLAIQKRASEVWAVLGAVKTEFGKFGEVLAKVKKKIDEASNTIDSAEQRTRVIQRKLRQVEELPAAEATRLLGAPEAADAPSDEQPSGGEL
ncbi:MAG: DNA recombination protein RmuC, partial [Verrucomicrobia bacterium]|nr:DNA recombination protein RmuC [Verrucomicrobiota bacterium]